MQPSNETKNEMIHEHHESFMNISYLCRVFTGHPILLEPTTLVNHFIGGCQHASYLLVRSRVDRLDPTKAKSFTLAQVHFTMTQHLRSSDAPRSTSTMDEPAIKNPCSNWLFVKSAL
jgi:hypothetical protein